MTTKETFDFNLQLFAVPTSATISASDGNIVIKGTGETVERTVKESEVSTISATIESETYVEWTAYTDTGKHSSDGLDYTYDSSTEAWTATIPAVTALDTETYVFDGTAAAGYDIATITAASESELASSTVASPATINAGTYTSSGVVLEGIGTATLDGSDKIALKASGSNISLTDIDGEIAIDPTSGDFNQKIGDAALNFTVSTAVSIEDGDSGVTIGLEGNNGEVSLRSIDKNQIWDLDKGETLKFNGIAYAATADAVISSNGEIIDIDGDSVSVSGASASTKIGYNDVTITGAVTSLSGDDTITALADGVIAANGSSASLTNDGQALITSDSGIVSISNGTWTLSSDNKDAVFGNNLFDFSEGSATITVEDDDVSKIEYKGTASIHGTQSLNVNELNVNNKATWDIAGASKNATVGFANNGAVSLSGDAKVTFHTVSGGASTIAASTGKSSLTLQDGGYIVADDDGDITNVGGLAKNATWVLDEQTVATVDSETFTFSDTGATITAGDSGNAAKIAFSDTATLSSANNANLSTGGLLTINSGAAWNIAAGNATTNAIFDADADVTLNSTSATAVFSTGNVSTVKAQFTDSAGDLLTVQSGGAVAVGNNSIAVNSVVGGSDIIAKSKNVAIGDQTYYTRNNYNASIGGSTSNASVQAWEFDNDEGATLKANSAGTAATLASFTNNATLTGASISPVSVGDDSWTIKGTNGVIFNQDGSATVAGGTVTGSANADLNLHGTSVVANGVSIYSADTDVDLSLASVSEGINSINNVATGRVVTIGGDTLFSAKNSDDGTAYEITANEGKVSLEFAAEDELILTVASGNAYTVDGGDVDYIVNYGKGSSLAAVTLDGAAVSLTAASGTSTATIYGSEDDAISSIEGVQFGDVIRTNSNDKVFTVAYAVDSSFGASEEKVITINDTSITLDRGDLGLGATDQDTLYVSYDGSGSIPNVTLRPITNSNAATIRASRGVYNIGQSRTGEIDDDFGYIRINESGQATIEGSSVTESRENRQSVTGAAATVGANSTVPAYTTFYDIEDFASNVDSDLSLATQVHYPSSVGAADSTVTSAAGINIIGNTTLSSGDLSAVTLQSYIPNAAINITDKESSNNNLHDVYIDASNNGPTLVAVGMTGDSIGAINHTILGSNSNSTLMIGQQATGNNRITAGNGNDYLYHAGAGVVTLEGGNGNDSIVPGNSDDVVVGGSGADIFYDSNDVNDVGYRIQDYSISDHDVILATKLSSVTSDSIQNFISSVSVSGHAIAINGGPRITVGTDNSSSLGTAAFITDVNGRNEIPFAWANDESGTVNASEFGNQGAAILASHNDAEDFIIGSAGADTIYAGAGDSVAGGAGNDYVSLVSSDNGAGAMVELSNGVDTVMGWSEGFDNVSGDNAVYYTNPSEVNFGFTGNGQLEASISGSQLVFGDLNSSSAAGHKLLIGGSADELQSVYVLRNDVAITSDDVADRYYSPSKGNTLIFLSDVTDVGATTVNGSIFENTISLGSDKYYNINSIAVNNSGNTTVIGSSTADTIRVNAPTDSTSHYRKAVSLGGGNDLLYSGGADTTTAGIDLYFGFSSEGADTVNNFGYYNSDDTYGDSNDLLRIFNWDNGSVVGTTDRIDVNVNGSSRLTIARDTTDSSARDNAIQFQMGNDETTRHVAKIGVTSGTSSNTYNSFSYDEDVDIYYGNTASNRDTLSYGGNDDVNVWLENKEYDATTYYGIGVINASNVGAGASLTLAGSGSVNNTVIGGGSQASLWGGYGGSGNDLLIGGSGNDRFFFGKGNGNDTVSGAETGGTDSIFLYDVTLADIANATVVGSDVAITLNDGSSLRVTNANGVHFGLADGSVYAANTSGTGNSGHSDWNTVSAS